MNKKTISFLLIIILLISGMKVIQAEEKEIEIKNIEISEKSENVDSEILVYADLTFDTYLSMYNVDDYITYKMVLKNNTGEDYKIESITDTNKNEFLSYSYITNKEEFKKDEEIELFVTIKYSKLVSEKQENLKEELNIILNYTNGKSTEIKENIVDLNKKEEINNPKTNDNFKKYILLSLIGLTALVVLIIKNNKKKDWITINISFYDTNGNSKCSP